MANALIIYASLTGTTLDIAHILVDRLQHLHIETMVKKCTDAYPTEFLDFDICVFATYTYGADGDLPEEAEDFYFDLANVDLKGKVFGVLGSGDRIYEKFCPAVDDFDQQFEKTGASRGTAPLKINLDPNDEDKDNITRFAKNLKVALEKKM